MRRPSSGCGISRNPGCASTTPRSSNCTRWSPGASSNPPVGTGRSRFGSVEPDTSRRSPEDRPSARCGIRRNPNDPGTRAPKNLRAPSDRLCPSVPRWERASRQACRKPRPPVNEVPSHRASGSPIDCDITSTFMLHPIEKGTGWGMELSRFGPSPKRLKYIVMDRQGQSQGAPLTLASQVSLRP